MPTEEEKKKAEEEKIKAAKLGDGGTPDPKPLIYDTWLNEQPKEVQELLSTQTAGLKSALDSERGSRKKLETDLRDLAKKAEGEHKVALEKAADELGVAEQRAMFYEDAQKAGVSSVKLAYHIATVDKLFDGRGNVDFERMKTSYPQLFGEKSKGSKGGAGSGLNEEPQPADDFNKMIRGAGGRV